MKSLFTAAALIFTSTALADLVPPEADSSSRDAESEERESPVVGKFRRNIYKDEYFKDSVYYDNLSAFWAGYNMQSYLYAGDCLDKYSNFMNS
mmetsp:Transcript_26157/g.32704  ORF Transcript_26157/g.32704 Transcript_26157/m.32704 type:complete len:93 (+) Transcript_26157:56-334(+)